MTRYINLLLLSCLLLFSSCATIISGSRQEVEISSEPALAKVFINDVETGITPVVQNLKRNQDYTILIKKDGYKTYRAVLKKQFNEWYLGNILLGGVVGLIIDPITGAMYRLSPKEIHKNFNNSTASAENEDTIFIAVSLEIDPNWERVY